MSALKIRAEHSIVINKRFVLLNAPIDTDQPQTFMIYFVRRDPCSRSQRRSVVSLQILATDIVIELMNIHSDRIDGMQFFRLKGIKKISTY